MRVRSNLFLRAAALLAVIITIAAVPGCGSAGDEDILMSCRDSSLTVRYYNLMLSRMKAELARSKYDVNNPEFWNSEFENSGKSWAEYCGDSILESMKIYLAGLVLFNENGLELTDEYMNSVDEDMEFYVDYDGDGSKDKFEEILSGYGADYDTLRTARLDEYRVALVQAYLYGTNGNLIGSPVKEEYFKDNYYCFKQILIANYRYEYEKDEDGQTVYYDSSSGKPAYDAELGHTKTGDDGKVIKDKDGQTVYFTDGGLILYDTVNGVPSYVSDENGDAKKFYYSDEEMTQRSALATELLGSINAGDRVAFEEKMTEISDDREGNTTYTDGYYLSDIESASFGSDTYLKDILDKLKVMDNGDTALIKSDYGYHLIMKYKLTSAVYGQDKYETMFKYFISSLTNKLFTDKCSGIGDEITIDNDMLGKVMSANDIKPNYDY